MPFERLPEPWTYFVDRCFGTGVVPARLREVVAADGAKVIVHDDEFPQNTKDVAWLPIVGERGWVLITKDNALRKNVLETNAILHSGVAAFAMGSAGHTAERNAEGIVTALRAIERCLRRFRPPFIATVTITGEVYVGWDERGRLEKAVHVRGK